MGFCKSYNFYIWYFPVLKVLHDNNKNIYNYLFIIITMTTVGNGFMTLINIIIIG